MIRRQVVMPVSPEQLWAALTEPEQVATWFGARVEWDLRTGGAARFTGDDGRERRGRVEAVRPGRHLRFRWWPEAGEGEGAGQGDPGAGEGDPGAGEVTEVSYLLEPLDEGTRLTIQERQLAEPAGGPAGAAGSAGPQASAAGWTAWDTRLVGAWAGVAVPALAGVRL